MNTSAWLTPRHFLIVRHTVGLLDCVFCVSAYLWLPVCCSTVTFVPIVRSTYIIAVLASDSCFFSSSCCIKDFKDVSSTTAGFLACLASIVSCAYRTCRALRPVMLNTVGPVIIEFRLYRVTTIRFFHL